MPQGTPTPQITPGPVSTPLNGFNNMANSFFNANANYFGAFNAPAVQVPQLQKTLTPSFQALQGFANIAGSIVASPGQTLIEPAARSLGASAGVAAVAGAAADFAAPGPKVGQAYKVLKLPDLLKAKNLLTPTTEKPGSVMRQMNEMANGRYEPVKVRSVGKDLIIEDGRHRIEAARQLGTKELLVEDVTKLYEGPKQGRRPDGRFDYIK